MEIVAVEKLNAPHRYRILFEDGGSIEVHEDTLVSRRLLKGERISEELLKQISSEEEQRKAFHSALLYLSRRSRSSKEISDRLLHKGYDESTIQQVLRKLADERYVDDQQYAVTLANYRLKSHRKGRLWIQYELSQKGVDEEHILHALSQLDEEEESESACRLLMKKYPAIHEVTVMVRRKLLLFLKRRGFTTRTAHQAVASWERKLRSGSEE
ncbi:MAG: RecX family transcriptional regulator [Paenibacillaceae bacterium]|jgi:regulatory protein|nr:RecX family transcriptional regulator [Paenibacillaceae bacterium]